MLTNMVWRRLWCIQLTHMCLYTCHRHCQGVRDMWNLVSIWLQQKFQVRCCCRWWFGARSQLLFMHTFSGCDTVSSFCGIFLWRKLFGLLPLCLATFLGLHTHKEMDRFLYSCTSQLVTVNAARKQLLYTKLKNLPPSRAALLFSACEKSTSFQAGHIWKQSLELA